jgi:hypothetical protein
MIKISDRMRAIALGAGSAAAAVVALVAPAAHAQVTFSATAPQTALQTVVDGAVGFFYQNAPGVLLTGIAIGIVLGLASWLIGRLMHRRSVK